MLEIILKNFKNKFLFVAIFVSLSLLGAQAALKPTTSQGSQVSFDALPGDVKRTILPLIASSKVTEVAEAIRSLNITNKFFHNFISTPAGIISILEKMPYTANAIDLVELLRKTSMPVIQRPEIPEIAAWLDAANKRLEKGQELYMAATRMRDLKKISHLLANPNIDLNWKNPDELGETALLRASALGYKDVVNRLLAAGANVNIPNNENRTPLIAAAYYGKATIISLLLNAGANVNAQDSRERTALFFATKERHPNAVKMLLDAHANPNIPDTYGATPLLVAAYSNLGPFIGSFEITNKIMELLLKENANPNVRPLPTTFGGEPETPLSMAITDGNVEGVRLLLAYGANPDWTINGKNARDLAQENGYAEIVKLLDEASKKWKAKQ